MVSSFQNGQLITDSYDTFLLDWYHLHSKTAYQVASSSVNIAKIPKRTIRLCWVLFACDLVYIWKFATRGPTGGGILVVSNLDLLPCILGICFWPSYWLPLVIN